MSYFKDMCIGNTTYDLRHLDPFKLSIQFEDKSYTVLVRFSCHCFTERLDADEQDGRAVYKHKEEKRLFSVDRYELSRSLPGMIRSLDNCNMTVYHTRQGSFFFARNASPLTPCYMVFFRAYKAKKKGIDVIVDVVSAYPKDHMVRRASPVKFPRVIDATAKGRPPPLGPTCRVKRG